MKILSSLYYCLIVNCALFISLAAYGQRNLSPGYIIQHEGDTLQGYIDYRNWKANPTSVSFFEDLEAQPTLFLPSDITAFGVADEYYVSAIVDIEISPVNFNRLSTSRSFETRKDTVFLQTVVAGMKELYHFEDATYKNHFYIRQDDEYELLLYKEYLITSQKGTFAAKNKQFTVQLSNYLSDSPELQPRFEKVSYDKKEIERLFLAYYKDKGATPTFYRPVDKVLYVFGVVAGISRATLTFQGASAHRYLIEADYTSPITPSIGVSMDIVLPRNMHKWSIYNELLWATNRTNGHFENVQDATYTAADIQFRFSYLKLQNMARYRFPVGSIHGFINAGISNGYAIVARSQRIRTTRLANYENVTQGIVFDNPIRLELGYVAGAGAGYEKYGFEFRYERGSGFSPLLQLSSNSTWVYALMSYRF